MERVREGATDRFFKSDGAIGITEWNVGIADERLPYGVFFGSSSYEMDAWFGPSVFFLFFIGFHRIKADGSLSPLVFMRSSVVMVFSLY